MKIRRGGVISRSIAFALLAFASHSSAQFSPQLTSVVVTGNRWEYEYNINQDYWHFERYGEEQSGSGGGGYTASPQTEPSSNEVCPVLRAEYAEHNCDVSPTEPAFNGCGRSGILGAIIPESWEIGNHDVNIESQCNQHDLCYGNLSSPRAECDAQLSQGVAAVCMSMEHRNGWRDEADSLITPDTHPGQNLADVREEWVSERINECMGLGNVYQGVVQLQGQPAFQEARQSTACKRLHRLMADKGCL